MSSISKGADFGWPFIFLLAMITALDAMAIDMYLPAFPAVAAEFAVSPGRVQQTLSVFLIGLALGQAVYGPLLDRFGRRKPLLIGLLIFVVGSVLAATASNLEWLLVARFLQALGAAAGLVAPRAIVSDVYTGSESSRVFSVLMQVMMIAPILAPVAGGFLLGHGGWRMIFWALAVIGALGTLWGWRAISETLTTKNRTRLSVSSVARAYWTQCMDRPFFAYALAGGFILGSLFVYISASPFVLIQHFGLSPVQFSYFFASNAVGFVLAGQLSIWLTKRLSEQRVLLLGIALHALAGAALALAVTAGVAQLWLYLGLLAISIWALGLTFGNLTSVTMARAGEQAGVASALMGTMQYLVGACVGLLVSLAAPGLMPLPLAILVCGVLAIICCRWAALPDASSMDWSAAQR
ncbi:multidrug effflux MFS transporter [Ottowia thiooxydans]|uniref:multidrug effflux MFS transporter n=1 Tax=Ottowia thiooxydans TaxID=219182 RepID=UPI0003F61F36|nr:multidrug effflux MFS transporter [Ottowia thiooxydans]